MNYLIQVTPILGAIPDELYPSMNAGYEYGQSREVILTEEEYFQQEPNQESFETRLLGTLPVESKIC